MNKDFNISYFRIDAKEENYFINLFEVLESSLDSDILVNFEAKEKKYIATIIDKSTTDETPMYFLLLTQEKQMWPVVINNENPSISELMLNEHLGDPFFGLLCPKYKFLLTTGCSTGFKRLLGQFSPEGVVRLNPILKDNPEEKVLDLDNFTSLSVSMNMPSGEDVNNFMHSKYGRFYGMLGYLGGLKLDATISAGSGKETLSSFLVRDVISDFLENELCTSLMVKGHNFDGTSENVDLKNAVLKHKETVEVEGRYVSNEDVKQLLMRALHEYAQILLMRG